MTDRQDDPAVPPDERDDRDPVPTDPEDVDEMAPGTGVALGTEPAEPNEPG
jgi:hypothetical protein